MPDQDHDPAHKIQKLTIQLAALETAAAGMRRDLADLKRIVSEQDPDKKTRHLWAVPGVVALAAWQLVRRQPAAVTGGALVAGGLVAAAVALGLPPEDDEVSRPPVARPPVAEPMPPVPLGPEPGEKRDKEPHSGTGGSPVASEPDTDDPAEPEPEQPVDELDPPAEADPPKEPPLAVPSEEKRCVVDVDLSVARARVVVSVCSSA